MVNQFGLDMSYFQHWLNRMSGDIAHYAPAELARELARMSKAAHPEILREPEFFGPIPIAEVFGLPVFQEPKYTVNSEGRLINRASGKAIPDDEPVFIFRACDKQATVGLNSYLNVLRDNMHIAAVAQRIAAFQSFEMENPDRMKMPDTHDLII